MFIRHVNPTRCNMSKNSAFTWCVFQRLPILPILPNLANLSHALHARQQLLEFRTLLLLLICCEWWMQ
jgi:hypothetical protein